MSPSSNSNIRHILTLCLIAVYPLLTPPFFPNVGASLSCIFRSHFRTPIMGKKNNELEKAHIHPTARRIAGLMIGTDVLPWAMELLCHITDPVRRPYVHAMASR